MPPALAHSPALPTQEASQSAAAATAASDAPDRLVERFRAGGPVAELVVRG